MGDTSVRMLGALFMLQAIVRLGFIANMPVRLPAFASNPQLLLTAVILPGLIAFLVVIAGGAMLALQRSARGFSLLVCEIALAFQLYAFGSTLIALYVVAPAPGRSPGLLFWILQPAYITLFVVGLVVLIRWRPPERSGR
jgi:hypothetical protein